MSEPFIAEIRIFPFNFAPRGWAFCNGQLLPVAQNTALFSLVGTVYGGDGRTTFALPNLQGRTPMHPGQGPGLSPRQLGEQAGSETVTLLESQIPAHSHTMRASSAPGETPAPSQSTVLARSTGGAIYQTNTSSNLENMAPEALEPAGGSQPHNNLQPTLTLHFCIALQGLYPSRP